METNVDYNNAPEPHSCHYCQAVVIDLSRRNLSNRAEFSVQGTLDITCSQARHASTDGCKLFEYLMQSPPSDRDANDFVRYNFNYGYTPAETSSIHFLYPADSRNLQVYGDGPTVEYFHVAPNLAPGSMEAVNEASNWLTDCVNEHTGCASLDRSFVPPRLLRVTGAQEEVFLTNMDVKKPRPYAILSYCWGGDQIFKTLKSNVDTPSRALRDLPQTIQDAVYVTRNLGLEYLWVDSMCIIQDSDEDKSALISQMHKIYACAHVTIAATNATRCTDGFLAPRHNIPMFRVPIRWSTSSLGSVILTPSPDTSYTEPLATRAWTLQESILSGRILSYGSRQLRWYCSTTEYTNGGILDRDPANFASFQSLQEIAIDYPRRRLKSGILSRDPTSLPWIEIVEQYTQRNLSVSSDKLVAISAVAQYLVTVAEGKWGGYHAGIWKERLFEQLLWSMSSREIAVRPTEYRAPSWSWAAVDGRPKWPWMEHLVDAKISCKLVEIETQPLRPGETFGAVTTGSLKVLGKVKEAIWSADRKTITDGVTGAAITDTAMETFPDAVEEDPQDMAVHVLEVARRSSLVDKMEAFNFGRTSTAGKYVAGLVLQHLGNEVYQRVGFIGLRSVKVTFIIMQPSWSKVENKDWWSEGFTKKTIKIL